MTQTLVTTDPDLAQRLTAFLDAKDFEAADILMASAMLTVIEARLRYSHETEQHCVHCWLLAVWEKVVERCVGDGKAVVH